MSVMTKLKKAAGKKAAAKRGAKTAPTPKKQAPKMVNIAKVRGTRTPQSSAASIGQALADKRRLAESREPIIPEEIVAPSPRARKGADVLPMPPKAQAQASNVEPPPLVGHPTLADILPPAIAALFQSGYEYYVSLHLRDVETACAPSALEVVGEPLALELESKLHEKKLISKLAAALDARDSELKGELKDTFELTGSGPVSFRGLWAKPVDSHSVKISADLLLKRGVAAADIEAATEKTPYTYIGIYDPADKGSKGGSEHIHGTPTPASKSAR